MSDEQNNNPFPVTDLAASAIQIHEVFPALVEAGFKEHQAMQVLVANIHAVGGVG